MKLSEIARVIGAGDITDFKVPVVDSFGIDSRRIKQGQLFIAIAGDRFDGHDFITEAASSGALAAIVSRPVKTTLPVLQVADTRRALAELACHHRCNMPATVMGITGSCGKTTTKTLLASILAQCGPTLSSIRSFNNDIGVPLTLLQLQATHQYAVCEMGANHAGEIAALTQWVKPDVAVITNAAAAHLDGFGSVRGVAHAKAEIFQGLSADGTAVINNDDQYAEFWRQQTKSYHRITFGRYQSADVMADSVTLNRQAQVHFRLCLANKKIPIQLQLMGEHHVMNALAAAAMAYAKAIPVTAIKAGLEVTPPADHRLVEKKGYAGATIIDDTYNANPSSVLAAVSVLAQREGKLIFVLGDMLELGEAAEDWHRRLGERVAELGIQHLYCYGDHSRYAAIAFGNNGHHFTSCDALLSALRHSLHEGVVVLVKGSNAMGMNKITQALVEE